MKSHEIEMLMREGVRLFARRPKHGDTEIELLTAERLTKGYVYGDSTQTMRKRWPVLHVMRVEDATALVDEWTKEARRAQYVRRQTAALQAELTTKLAQLEVSTDEGPCSDRTTQLSLSLHELRKLVALLRERQS